MVRPITDEHLGLRVLYDGTSSTAHPEAGGPVDIVAVHGMGAHPDDTWCRKTDGDDGPVFVNWLEDPRFLPAVVPRARVMRYGYTSDWFGEDAIKTKMSDISQTFLFELDDCRKTNQGRPLILIGHSFGGLVLLKSLVDAHTERKRWPGVYDSTVGLVFLGTPFRGTHDSFSQGEILKRAYEKFTGPVHGENLGIFRAGGESLTDLVDLYLRIARQSPTPRVACFYEQRASDVGRILGKDSNNTGPKIPSVILVNETSGSLDLNEKSDKHALPRTHFDIQTFGSPAEQGFRLLRSVIQKMVEEGPELVSTRARCSESKDGRYVANPGVNDPHTEECIKDLRVTDPRADKTRLEQTKGGLLVDAYRWILDNDKFRQWRDDENSRLLWIKGDPGKGKTMLLCGIIDELEQSIGNTGLLSFFFCQATDTRINSATAVLRSLLYLLVKQQPFLVRHIRDRHKDAGKQLFKDVNTWATLLQMFTCVLEDPDLQPTFLVIDALDECVADLPLLLEFIVNKSPLFSRAKWIVSSRNWPSIKEQLDTASNTVMLCLELNKASVSAAIGNYISYKIDRLTQLKKYSDKTRDAIHRHLSSNANDTFLWVALVCQNLREVPRWEVPAKLHSFPPGLDSLYRRMMDQIQDSGKADLCNPILAIMSTVYRPITLTELSSTVETPGDLPDDYESLTEILGLCGSFLTLREQTIYFVHQSAKDFIRNKASDKIFPSGVGKVHYGIFSMSLQAMQQTLRRDIYELRNPGYQIGEVRAPDPDPLAAVRYACVYWVDHLCDSDSCLGKRMRRDDDLLDGGTVYDFLCKKYLNWLEALSLVGGMSEGVYAIRRLETFLLTRRESPQLADIVLDARRFILSYKWIIENNPLQVYASALVFSPTRSIIRNRFRGEAPRIVTQLPTDDDWSACLQTLEGHSSRVNSATFSPDGRLVASASNDDTIKLWDPATGTCTQTLKGHSGSVHSATFSPDGRLVASASYDKTVKLWVTATGTCTQTLKGHSSYIISATFSPDGRLVASASWDNTVKLWDPATGTCTQTFKGHSSHIMSATFSPDGRLVASASYDKTVKLWVTATGTCTQTLKGHSSHIMSATFSPDGRLVASASYDNTVKLWDPATGTYTQTLKGHSNAVISATFSPDGRLVASASWDNTVKLWDPATGTCIQTFKGHSSYIFSATFSPDGRLVASASYDNTVKLWDPATGTCTQTLESHSNAVNSATFSPDGRLVASASNDKTVKLWDPATGTCTQTLEGHSSIVNSATFSPDDRLIASASYDKTVKLWDPATGTCTQTLEGHSSIVYSATFSPDGRLVASASNDDTIKLWDPATGTCTQTLEGHSSIVYSATFSPDGRLVASASYDNTVKLWDPATGTCTQTLKGHSSYVISATFSPDGRLVASASNDNTIKLWDPATGTCTQTLKGHSSYIISATFSPDGRLVASASNDNTVKLWDPATGTCTQTLEGHRSSVNLATFSPDGKIVASASEDNTVKLWDPATGTCMQTLSTGRTLRNISFNKIGSHLDTDIGTIDLGFTYNSPTRLPNAQRSLRRQGYGVSSHGDWIIRNSENWLWLPPEYRPTCSAIAGSSVAIGCASGRFLVMAFP